MPAGQRRHEHESPTASPHAHRPDGSYAAVLGFGGGATRRTRPHCHPLVLRPPCDTAPSRSLSARFPSLRLILLLRLPLPPRCAAGLVSRGLLRADEHRPSCGDEVQGAVSLCRQACALLLANCRGCMATSAPDSRQQQHRGVGTGLRHGPRRTASVAAWRRVYMPVVASLG